MNWPLHGSNPAYIYHFLNIDQPENILDFSVNINPYGPPSCIADNWHAWLQAASDYPDPQRQALTDTIARKEGLSADSVLAGNGAAELITMIAAMLRTKRVLVIQPAFSEYERMCKVYGCQLEHWILPEGNWTLAVEELKQWLPMVDAVFLCNPNNPTGIEYSVEQLKQVADTCKEYDCFFIVDEAFYDFVENPHTIAPMLNYNSKLIILRSLTKMYAIAGLRLGYVLADPQVIQQLYLYQTHWSVNALALMAGEACLADEAYIEQTRTLIAAERNRITGQLKRLGYILSPSSVNYYLLRDPDLSDQLALFQFLLKKGIVPRHTANYQGLAGRWMRFAVKQKEQNDRLLEALKQWKKIG